MHNKVYDIASHADLMSAVLSRAGLAALRHAIRRIGKPTKSRDRHVQSGSRAQHVDPGGVRRHGSHRNGRDASAASDRQPRPVIGHRLHDA